MTVSKGAVGFDAIWEDAYQRLKDEDPDLLQTYQKAILEETRKKCKYPDSRASQLQAIALSAPKLREQLEIVVEVQSEYIEERQWVIGLGEKKTKVRDVVRKIVKGIDAAKGFIGAAASNEPHAALAWAGVSCLLPLILNATSQDDDAIAGLDYIQALLGRYQVTQRILVENSQLAQGDFEDADFRKRMREDMVVLYYKTLKYQFAMVKQYSHSTVVRTLRNMFGPVVSDDWTARLNDVKGTVEKADTNLTVLKDEKQDLINTEVHKHTDMLGKILTISEEQKAVDEQEKLEDWLKEMFPKDMDAQHGVLRQQIPERRLKDAGIWFAEKVTKWLDDDEKMILWARGMPGAGKSICMSKAIEDLGPSLNDHAFDGMAYVYLTWEKKSQQTSSAVLASILYKLSSRSKSLSMAIKELKDKKQDMFTKPESWELKKILREHGRRSDFNDGKDFGPQTHARFLLFLDGLDEADDKAREEFLPCIDQLDPRFFRVVMTSRKDLSITTKPNQTTEMEITADPADLGRYIKTELEHSEVLANQPEVLKELVIDIRDRAHGMFLHAKHHTAFVDSKITLREMREAAKHEFENLPKMYDEILNGLRLEEGVLEEHAMKALAWLTYAKETMDAETLAEALAIKPGDTTFDPDSKPSIDVVVRLCRGLISFDKGSDVIRLEHQTIEEYLRSLESIKALQSELVATCFTRLALGTDDPDTREHHPSNSTMSTRSATEDTDLPRVGTDDWMAELEEEQSPEKAAVLRATTDDWMADLGNADSCRSKSDPDDSQGDLSDIMSSDYDSDESNSTDDMVEDSSSLNPFQIPEEESELFFQTKMMRGVLKVMRDPSRVQGSFTPPHALHEWADQTTKFSKYAGQYAIRHLLSNRDQSAAITSSIWNFLTKSPGPGLFKKLRHGHNRYLGKCTPMHIAVWTRHVPTIRRLAQEKIDINVLDGDKQTPLSYAIRHVDATTLSKLIDMGADPSLPDWSGTIPIEHSVVPEDFDSNFDIDENLVRRLIPRDYKFDESWLRDVAAAGYSNVIKVSLELGIGNPDTPDKVDGLTPLHHACKNGHLEIVRELCGRGVDVNAPTKNGSTPLHMAIEAGDAKILHFLLNRGADPNQVDHRNEHALLRIGWGGRMPERHLSEHDALDLLAVLLKHKPNLEIKSNCAGTALWEAVSGNKSPRLVQALVDAGCDIHSEEQGYTPFQKIAVLDPDSETYRVLLRAEVAYAKKIGRPFSGALPNSEGNTALHIAAAGPEDNAVKKLLRLPGVDVNACNLAGRTPLFLAMHLRGERTVRRLLNADPPARVDLIDYKGNSILDAALTAAPTDVIATILDMGRIMNQPCSVEVRWDANSIDIQQYANEPWFDHLLELIALRAGRKEQEYASHVSATLDRPRSVYDHQSVEEKRVLDIEIPRIENIAVQKVIFRMKSHDQGRSWKQDELGNTYSGAYSWFDVGIVRDGQGKLESIRTIQQNLHASFKYRSYTISLERDSKDPRDRDWINGLQQGDKIVVLGMCFGDGWSNHIESLSIDVFSDVVDN